MLTDKVALVTGGARGIGAGIDTVMARQGARVAILDLDGVTAKETAAGLAMPGIGIACDVAVPADVEQAVRLVVERCGGHNLAHQEPRPGVRRARYPRERHLPRLRLDAPGKDWRRG